MLEVVGTDAMVEMALEEKNAAMPKETPKQGTQFKSSLAGHIGRCYFDNKQARRDSGIEQEMLAGMAAFNGEFEDMGRSDVEAHGGSRIFMNLTATKCRACASWIKDIMMPSQGRAWRLMPPKDPEIAPQLMQKIEEMLEQEYTRIESQAEDEGSPPPGPNQGAQPAQPGTQPVPPAQAGQPQQPGQPQPQGQQAQAEKPGVVSMATKLREMNKAKRDIQRVYNEEVELVSKFELEKLEKRIDDELAQGDWARALSEFIEDFTVFPAAFMKGPIMSIKPRLQYNGGEPVVTEEMVYMNKRVSPLDMYPSANASTVNDGNLIEHIRFERHEISEMKKLGQESGYDTKKIEEVLTTYKGEEFIHWLWTDIESDKATAEKRGTEFQANKNIIHALHFFGKASISQVKDWGYKGKLEGHDTDQVEIEALLVDNEVIKCVVNEDPLCRRPYYKASFQTRPGSFWGRSLPNLMRDIQRMCNATARALANNMGVASGPQLEVVLERLADRGDITEVTPMKVWQTNSDPTGAGGRAIQFHQPSSNAAELLAVYKEFELRADDATGIPRYAYGNERTGGAAQTASGLSMLLESASKGIKDAIRHIDYGLIIPRIEYQFYWLMKENKNLDYSGALKVQGVGSAALTMKAAEQAKRVELMQALSGNPQILEVVGPEAMAQIFKTLFQDANMDEVIIPNGLEIRQKVAEKEAQAQEAAKAQSQAEQAKVQAGLQATELQINGQKEMHQGTMKLKQMELELKREDSMAKSRDKARELDSRERQTAQNALSDAEQAKSQRDFEDNLDRRKMAFELADLREDKSPTQANQEK